MNIADKLRKVLEIKNNIKAALEEKGIENVGENFNSYAESIANISGGGGDEPEIPEFPKHEDVYAEALASIPEPELEPWVQPEDWIDLRTVIENHSHEDCPYRIALLLQYDNTDSIVLGTTGRTTCKCITVDDGGRGFEYDVEEGNYAITHSWDGYTGTNGYRWVIYHFDTPEANFRNYPTSCVQAIFDGINASGSGYNFDGSGKYTLTSFKGSNIISLESINDGSIVDISFKDSVSLRYISPNILGNRTLSSLESMFSGCYSLEYAPNIDASNSKSLYSMFYNCYSLKYVSINNTSNVTNFSNMFYSCSSLVTISELNTSNGTNFGNMFYNCSSLVSIPELNTSNGTSFGSMFYGCSSLVTISELNTSNGTNFGNMFCNCSSLVTIPELNTSNGTSFNNMFQNCFSLLTIPELNFENGTNNSYLFDNCTSLVYLPQLNFPETTSFSNVINGCSSLKTIIGINAPNVTSISSSLFTSCGNLKYVGKITLGIEDWSRKINSYNKDLEYIEIDAPNGKNFNSLFSGTSSLRKVVINAPLCTNTGYMFENCTLLREVITTPETTFSQCTSFGNMFYNCSSLVSIPELNISNGTNFNRMFYNCSSLVSIPELNTMKCSDFSNMFYNCSSLVSIPLLDTSNGTNFSNMFYGCSSLVTIPLLDTSNGTDFSYMFSGCKSLVSIPLLDTSNGTSFGCMFQYCSSLVSIPLLDTSNGTSFNNMFYDCGSLTTIPDLNFENAKSVYSIFSGCRSLKKVPLINAPKATGTERYYFSYCYNIEEFGGMLIPSVTGISELFGSTNNNYFYKVKDLGVWDLSGITSSIQFPINYNTKSLRLAGKVRYKISVHYNVSTVPIRDFEIEELDYAQNFNNWKLLTHQSLLNILNSLVPQEGATKTLTLGSDNLAKLTDEEKAIATDKGWTLA
jgi:hypothetical protein